MKLNKDKQNKIRSAGTAIAFPAALVCILILSLSGCRNTVQRNSSSGTTLTTAPVTLTADNYVISNVDIAPPTGGGTTFTNYRSTIYFDGSRSSGQISNHCSPNSTTNTLNKNCICRFTWSEVNTSTGNSITIPRNVQSPVITVQPSLVACDAPSVYTTEIPDGTTIRITVVAAPGSNEQFTVTAWNFVKSAQGSNPGSFRDAQGRSFMNISRYACHDQFYRGMTITSKLATATSRINETASWPIANNFCVGKAISANTNAIDGCESMQGPEYSALSSYFNLYIRESEVGDINPGNTRYVCPKIKESLNNNTLVGGQGQYWPLDSNFALLMGKTADFPIGVEAFSRTSNTAELTGSTSCDGTTAGPVANTLVKSCLGFAAKPNPDGSCPYIRDSSGSIKFTYRLRRYFALFPKSFETDGDYIRNEAQPIDTVYVLDRPVNAPTNPDPLKPWTIYGPKPCPTAYFDHKRVLVFNNIPTMPKTTLNYYGGYASTFDSRWAGKNVDGIEFPNADSRNSCAAVLPVLGPDMSAVTLSTVNFNNGLDPVTQLPTNNSPLGTPMARVFVRPIKPWAPNYIEDTGFQACAPFSSNFMDPPLHFTRNPNTGNVSWCAEVAPTQNDNLSKIDVRKNALGEISTVLTDDYTGIIRPFTSHVSKNASVSPNCAKTDVTIPTSGYQALGNATATAWLGYKTAAQLVDTKPATQTCDRTVVNPGNGVNWAKFPLLAPVKDTVYPEGIEEVLASDKYTSYGCLVSFDNGTKAGKASPSDGCCNFTQVQLKTLTPPTSPDAAHLEPAGTPTLVNTLGCLTPAY